MIENIRYVTGYFIDNEGFVIETVPIDLENYDESYGIIVVQPKQSFYKFKWNGNDWIEGATQEEIDEILKVEPSPPSENEELLNYLLDVDMRLVAVEMGLI